MYHIVRSTTEIDDLMNWAAEGIDAGSHYPGMSFEEGIQQAVDWLTGQSDENPAG